MNTEERIILALSKPVLSEDDTAMLDETLTFALNWDQIIAQLLAGRTAALAYVNLQRCGLIKRCPRFAERSLVAYHAYGLTCNEIHLRELVPLTAALDEAGIRYCLLKGIVLAQLLYPAGIRAYSDIDILVRKSDITKTIQILLSHGFTSRTFAGDTEQDKKVMRRELMNLMLNGHQILPFVKQTQSAAVPKVCVDVQFDHMGSNVCGYQVDIKQVLDDAMRYEVGDYTYTSLSPEAFFAHICTHTYGDCTMVTEILAQKSFVTAQFTDILGWFWKYRDVLNTESAVKALAEQKLLHAVYFCVHWCGEIFSVQEEFADYKSKLLAYIEDPAFVSLIGTDVSELPPYQWDVPLEEKLFRFSSLPKIHQYYEPYLKRISDYTMRRFT